MKFQITPDQNQLAEIDRDIRFFPSVNNSPSTLTASEIQQFNDQGYLKGFRIFSADEIAEHRGYFDQLLEETVAAGKDSYSISTAHLSHGRVYDLLTNENIVSYVVDLLGKDVVGWGSHYFCKMPHDGVKVAWHQDAVYWPLTPSKTVTVWLAIDDAGPENACMQFIAGSHKLGHIAHEQSDPAGRNVLGHEIRDARQYGPIVNDELRAGEISLHNDLLLHGSNANQSDRRRCGLTLRYAAAEVRAFMDWNQKGVVVNGSDPSSHWANPARPAID